MNRRAFLLGGMAGMAVLSLGRVARALYEVANEGLWPKTWPKELEPLRKQARSITGPLAPFMFWYYEIPFTKREEFEAAWPHLLKVTTKGAPIFLVRSPNPWFGATIAAGVRVHSPPKDTTQPEAPLPGKPADRETWKWTNYIELVVDGQIVDLNRIALPAETPIVDERFGGGPGK